VRPVQKAKVMFVGFIVVCVLAATVLAAALWPNSRDK
jgi:hypothetical protein